MKATLGIQINAANVLMSNPEMAKLSSTGLRLNFKSLTNGVASFSALAPHNEMSEEEVRTVKRMVGNFKLEDAYSDHKHAVGKFGFNCDLADAIHRDLSFNRVEIEFTLTRYMSCSKEIPSINSETGEKFVTAEQIDKLTDMYLAGEVVIEKCTFEGTKKTRCKMISCADSAADLDSHEGYCYECYRDVHEERIKQEQKEAEEDALASDTSMPF